MAQPMVSNMNVNGLKTADTKDTSSEQNCDRDTAAPQHQPTVRHIPIFVEGRDQPLLNTNVERSPSDGSSGGQRQSSPAFNDMPKPGSIFDRVKDMPVRNIVQDFPSVGRTASPSRPQSTPINVKRSSSQHEPHVGSPGNQHQQQRQQYQRQTPHEQPQVQRSSSRAHTIPIKVEHTNSQRDVPREPVHQQQQASCAHNEPPRHGAAAAAEDEVDCVPQQQKSAPPVQQSLDAISKIQKIQKDVLDLMNCVEQYGGGSRKDKEYLYLDEMLTQNLLKLDTIDAEGKDNIKAARKEAIKCINKCIAVLEAKTESGVAAGSQEQQQQSQQSQQNSGGK